MITRLSITLLAIFVSGLAVSAQNVSGQVPPPTQDCSQASDSDFIKGTVRLKVVLLASGKIGDVTVVKGLSQSQTEQAIAAAKQIKFEPKKVNGVPVDTTRVFEYTFEFYFNEDSPELQVKAEIIKLPKPKFPKGPASYQNKKIAVNVGLLSDGTVKVIGVKGDFPQKFKDAAAKAASKIEFHPAIHKCGQRVSQNKTIEFEIQ